MRAITGQLISEMGNHKYRKRIIRNKQLPQYANSQIKRIILGFYAILW